ncbi:DEAD/DEAH box helicase [Maricurvus nonylphenolicus]|uniref:DEAD/DEAH box helicase n=1 Tax=Maricurvus nonylphenolicus TaxID=1008307 RepID=UPI0036F20E65
MSNDSLRFADLGLADAVLSATEAVGYETPSPIQAASIPHLLEGKDILGMAQTGTGKTAAFALPLLSRIDCKLKKPQVLVLAPTRELAIQVSEAFQTYAAKLKGFHVLPIYGGSDYRGQLRGLDRGPQVVVGTPGRVMDHLKRGTLKLDNLQSVVLDEADEMLRMGFIDDVTWILDQTPDEVQVALFSATMPREIRKVADSYLTDPEVVQIKAATQTVERIEQKYWLARGTHKLEALTRILEVENFDAIIMFVRTKTATAELAEKLEARGYAAAALNGDMSQQLRERAIERLKNGKLDIIIATDVAARGIDVARVSHVINYDIPYDTEAYVHRIGRTGRAGRTGTAILFVEPREKRMLYSIERATRQTIPRMDLPSREEVADKRVTQFKEQINEVMGNQDLAFYRELVMSFSQESDADPIDITAALAFMAQKERPLVLPPEEQRPRKERKDRKDRDDSRNDSRNNRGERGERPRRKDREDDGIERESFRIEVGYNHGVKPGDIVGAIANEADIDSSYIGSIQIGDDYSTVDLPKDMPAELMQHMQKVRVRNQQIRMALASDDDKQEIIESRRNRPRNDKPRGRRGDGYKGGYKGKGFKGGPKGRSSRS